MPLRPSRPPCIPMSSDGPTPAGQRSEALKCGLAAGVCAGVVAYLLAGVLSAPSAAVHLVTTSAPPPIRAVPQAGLRARANARPPASNPATTLGGAAPNVGVSAHPELTSPGAPFPPAHSGAHGAALGLLMAAAASAAAAALSLWRPRTRSLPLSGQDISVHLQDTEAALGTTAAVAMAATSGDRAGSAATAAVPTADDPDLADAVAEPRPPPPEPRPIADDEMPPPEARPGALDRANFDCDDSVQFWRDWRMSETPADGLSGIVAQLRALQAAATSPEDAAYWGYHIARLLFFATQGVGGVMYSRGNIAFDDPFGERASPAESGVWVSQNLGDLATVVPRLIAEAVATFRIDLQRIRAGLYRPPYDMDPAHRQFNPAFIADKAARFLGEAAETLGRADRGAAGNTTAPLGPNPELYPEYYLHAFHYQTDGWLSSASAKVYEASTETLFLGRQDAMQRGALVPLAPVLKGPRFAAGGGGARVLEVAAGTGRFATFLRDSHPQIDLTVTDLSPYYLEEARSNGAYWESLRSAAGHGPAAYVQANAERLPFEDASYDAVVCVYLFHELPAEAQDRAFEEAFRVLRPGGVYVVTDSNQLGDRPAFDERIGNFGDFAEPYYRAYVRRDFGALGKRVGFVPEYKGINSASKTLSFRKPEA